MLQVGILRNNPLRNKRAVLWSKVREAMLKDSAVIVAWIAGIFAVVKSISDIYAARKTQRIQIDSTDRIAITHDMQLQRDSMQATMQSALNRIGVLEEAKAVLDREFREEINTRDREFREESSKRLEIQEALGRANIRIDELVSQDKQKTASYERMIVELHDENVDLKEQVARLTEKLSMVQAHNTEIQSRLEELTVQVEANSDAITLEITPIGQPEMKGGKQ